MTACVTVADWDLVLEPRVEKLIDQAVGHLVRATGHMVEEDDARQEAALLVATNPDARAELARGDSHFYTWLARDLHDKFETGIARRLKQVSRDEALEDEESTDTGEIYVLGLREEEDTHRPVKVRRVSSL